MFWDESRILPKEQKGSRKHYLLDFDKSIKRNAQAGKKNLAMAWINYQKAYDMVRQSLIKECLNIFGIARNMKRLLVNSTTDWRTELVPENTSIREVKINRGIFQGDSLSPLLFVISMIPLMMMLRELMERR